MILDLSWLKDPERDRSAATILNLNHNYHSILKNLSLCSTIMESDFVMHELGSGV